MKKRMVVVAWVLAACGGAGGGGSDADRLQESASQALRPSFDVRGRWEGTATDEETALNVGLVLTSNGGAQGMQLDGQLDIDGVGVLPFSDSYVSPLAGATRIATITAADQSGYSYEILGEFTSRRMSGGQFTSSNPALDTDRVFLDVELVKLD